MPKLTFVSAALAALALAAPLQAAWVTSWAAAPVPPTEAMGPFPATTVYDNVTLRQVVRLSAGGGKLRLRLTNAYGRQGLAIGGARVAVLDAAGKEQAARTLTFDGAREAKAPPGAPLVSDPVDLPVVALGKLAVSLYLPGPTGPCSCHPAAIADLAVSPPGDFTAWPFTPARTEQSRAFLAAVEVDAPADAATVVMLGDSITDGVGSTHNADRRWPDLLAERLAARGGRAWGIANQGISGNRLLGPGMGEAALARFDRDVLAVPGVKALVVFIGVNDLGLAFGPSGGPMAEFFAKVPDRVVTPAQMIAGYRQIVARAQARGIRVIGATIAPYKGAMYWSDAGEAARQEINRFIRTDGAFDAVLDFDKVLADPADPAAIRADYHSGDHLHGSDAGYRAMAEAVDLALFE